MDGRNCTGRKISLLNQESSDPISRKSQPQHQRPRPLAAHSHSTSSSRSSRESSYTSSSPQTPLLIRSDSQDSRGFATPSPLTPSYTSFPPPKQHHHHQYYIANPQYAKMDDPNASMYPPIPDATGAMAQAYPMPQMPQQPPQLAPQQSLGQQFRTSDSPASASEPSRAAAQSSSKAPTKKNQYPCPMAKQVGCSDFFTTSGHAARHAKKHTGKKDAFCPECNKAFTRKDNMEQHRRTHQHGRGSSRSTNDDAKVKKPTKQTTRKTAIKPEPRVEAAMEQQLAEQGHTQQQQQQVQQAVQAQHVINMQQQAVDQMLMPAAGPYFLTSVDTGPIPSLPMPMSEMTMGRPQLHRSSFVNSLDYVPPTAPMVDPDSHLYSYPSPNGMTNGLANNLTNGLDSLALAASEHSRMSEKSQSRSPSSEATHRNEP
jgi:transcriptional regulator NrdR family protein